MMRTEKNKTMYHGTTALQGYARNLLIYTDGFEYNEPYIEVDTNTLKTATVKNNITYSYWPVNASFKLYPNPAHEYITLEYNIEYGTTNPVMEIVSIGGRHIETFRLNGTQGVKVIDLRSWNTGTYIIRLTVNGKTIQSEKFVKF